MVITIITTAIEKDNLLGRTMKKTMLSKLIVLMNFSDFQFFMLYLLKYSDRNDSFSTVVNARFRCKV